jgi:hypothetical protein
VLSPSSRSSMRAYNVLLTALAMSLATQTASAQQATLAVSARILPSVDALATGAVAPRLETGHTVVASAKLSDAGSVPASVANSQAKAAAGFVEFNLGVLVSANVQYRVAVSSSGDELKVQQRSVNGRQEIRYRVPAVVGSKPPAAVMVTLTAASIS